MYQQWLQCYDGEGYFRQHLLDALLQASPAAPAGNAAARPLATTQPRTVTQNRTQRPLAHSMNQTHANSSRTAVPLVAVPPVVAATISSRTSSSASSVQPQPDQTEILRLRQHFEECATESWAYVPFLTDVFGPASVDPRVVPVARALLQQFWATNLPSNCPTYESAVGRFQGALVNSLGNGNSRILTSIYDAIQLGQEGYVCKEMQELLLGDGMPQRQSQSDEECAIWDLALTTAMEKQPIFRRLVSFISSDSDALGEIRMAKIALDAAIAAVRGFYSRGAAELA